MCVAGEASTGLEAVAAAERLHPEVVVMDIGMRNLNGIEATQRIVAEEPNTSVVILSMHSDEEYILRALRAGARGYVLKESTEADLVSAVRAVAARKAFFSATASRILVEDYARLAQEGRSADPYDLLTAREREIFQLSAEGKSNKEIATDLGLSVYTVETHRRNLMAKMNLHSPAELILYAVRKRLIS